MYTDREATNSNRRTGSRVENNRFLDLLSTNRTFLDAIAAILTNAMATQEDHILQSVHADRTVHLLTNLLQLLLQSSERHRVAETVRCRCRRYYGRDFRFARRTLLAFTAQFSKGNHRFHHSSADEAFLHQTSTFFTGDQMSAWLVHHRCFSLRAHFALFNLNSCLNILLAQQALLHATGTRVAGNDVRARLKQCIALVVGAHETLHGCARRQSRLRIQMRLPVLEILLRQYTAEMRIRAEIEGTLILLVSHG